MLDSIITGMSGTFVMCSGMIMWLASVITDISYHINSSPTLNLVLPDEYRKVEMHCGCQKIFQFMKLAT